MDILIASTNFQVEQRNKWKQQNQNIPFVAANKLYLCTHRKKKILIESRWAPREMSRLQGSKESSEGPHEGEASWGFDYTTLN